VPAEHKCRRHTSAGDTQVPAALPAAQSRHRAGLSQTVSVGSGLLRRHALFALLALFEPAVQVARTGSRRLAPAARVSERARGSPSSPCSRLPFEPAPLWGLGPAPKPRALGGWGLPQSHGPWGVGACPKACSPCSGLPFRVCSSPAPQPTTHWGLEPALQPRAVLICSESGRLRQLLKDRDGVRDMPVGTCAGTGMRSSTCAGMRGRYRPAALSWPVAPEWANLVGLRDSDLHSSLRSALKGHGSGRHGCH
jgi:hypothetical protein